MFPITKRISEDGHDEVLDLGRVAGFLMLQDLGSTAELFGSHLYEIILLLVHGVRGVFLKVCGMVLQNRLIIHLLHLFQYSFTDPKVAVDLYLVLLHLPLGVFLITHLVHDLLET